MSQSSWRWDTDLQIDLQALMIDFCLKSDKMELLCDNQRGLEKAAYIAFTIQNLNCMNTLLICIECQEKCLMQKLNQNLSSLQL